MKSGLHQHVESALTGSTLTNMVKRALELKREYFTYTDLGHMSSALKTYQAAKKAKLKPVLGLEFYFKDTLCDLIGGTRADRCKYFTSTIFAMDQRAYQAIIKAVSRTDFTKITVQDNEQSLFTWSELENLSKFNTQLVLGGPHCLVGKTLLADGPELAEKVFLKLRTLFGDRLSVSLVCEPWDKKFAEVVKIDYVDGTYDSLLSTDTVTTDRARKIRAGDLLKRGGHRWIESKIVNNTNFDVNKEIKNISEHRGFLPLPLDATLEINKFLFTMHQKYGTLVLASDYAFYAELGDKIVQTMTLEGKTKLKPNLHMKSVEEFESYLFDKMGLTKVQVSEVLENNDNWAKNFDNFELKYELRLADSGEVPALQQCMDIIKKNGRMKWDNPVWVSRLREEINVIAKNGIKDLSAYFLPIHDVIAHYEDNGRLTGPARGSSAGSLIAYLMNITKVNPFLYDLSFNRFYSIDRIKASKWADIDSDLESRDLLVGEDDKSGYLYERWGNKAAQISTRGKSRLKSAIKDTNRYINGSVEKEIESITKALPSAPQGVTDEQFLMGFTDEDDNHIEGLVETSEVLQKYIESRPKEWDIVQKSLGITKSFSAHACGFVVSNIALSDIIPIKDGHITQYEASAVEEAGLMKYDFLVVNQLKDIRICIELINKKNNEINKVGYFSHNGVPTYIWDLPEDKEAYRSVWDGSTESCFQINTTTMTPFVKDLMPQNMEDLSLILSLIRPGPLDYKMPESGRNMAEEYIHRRNGNSYEDIPVLKELIPETHSVLVYQEQVTKIAKLLAGFSGSAAELLREAIGKKKLAALLKIKPDFINGCMQTGKVTEDESQQLWDRIVTFGGYAFNKSHGISYSYITYACMFLKHYYNLEFWTATLSNAKEREISGKLWTHVKHLVAPPDINLSSDEMVIDYANGKIRAKLGVIKGIGAASIDPIVEGRPYTSIQDFVNRGVAGPGLTRKLIHVGVLDSLFPPKSQLLQKLQLFENAVEIKYFNKKVADNNLSKRQTRALQPKKGRIPEEYLTIEENPLKNAAVQKSILPSLLVGLYDLGRHNSKCIIGRSKPSKLMTQPSTNKEVLLINSDNLQRLDEMQAEFVTDDRYVAACGFVVEMKIFDYKDNTRQALKLTIDFDGLLREYVMWPDFYTQQLHFPKDLAKGTICTFFLKKRKNKGDCMSIQEIVVEY